MFIRYETNTEQWHVVLRGVCKEDMEHAAFQIASKRMHLDDAISAIKGVHFFFSCVTSVASNLKSKRDEGGQNSQQTYPSIAYFIAYTPD